MAQPSKLNALRSCGRNYLPQPWCHPPPHPKPSYLEAGHKLQTMHMRQIAGMLAPPGAGITLVQRNTALVKQLWRATVHSMHTRATLLRQTMRSKHRPSRQDTRLAARGQLKNKARSAPPVIPAPSSVPGASPPRTPPADPAHISAAT